MEIEVNNDSCRVCLEKVGIIHLFQDQGDGIAADMINSVFKINILRYVNLPDTLCIMCMENIKSAVKTRETILNSEIVLSAYLEMEKSILGEVENFQIKKDMSELGSTYTEPTNTEPLDSSILSSRELGDASSTKSASITEMQPNLSFPGMYDCEKCKDKTATYKDLIYHKRYHPDLMLYECEKCGKSFKQQSSYRKHAASHLSHRPFKCTECGKGFKSNGNLAAHLLTHKTQPIIPCPKCDKLFCHMKALKQHLIVHNERTEVCKICNKKFKNRFLLKAHLARHSGQNQNISRPTVYVTCEICGKQVAVNNLKNHVNYKHLLIPRERKAQCSYCDKKFFSSANLASHMQCHFNSRKVPMDAKTKEQLLKHKCDECDKAFTSAVLFKKHKLIHSGVKDHVCSYCEKGFAVKSRLDLHVRLLHEVGNPKNCACEICGKVCLYKNDLQIHMLAHTGETPFHCKLCDSKFVYAKSLRIHVKNKHKHS